MRFLVPTLSHTFLRMGLFVVLAIILLTPVTPVFATHTGNPIDHATTYTPDIPIGPNGYPSFDLYAGTGIDTIAGTNGGQVYDIDSDGVADPGEPAYTPPAPTTDNAKEIIGYSNKLSDEKAYGIMIGLGGWIAGLGGNAFEIAFGNFVLKLGCYFTKPGCSLEGGMGGGAGQVGQIVNELWSVIRDLFNLALIFSLVYIGFRMILDAEDSSMKKALGNIIIAALLVNFSLYIAKLVVDIANFSAVQIYSHMIKPSGAQQLVIDGGVGDFSVGAGNLVAASFMEVLLIPSWFSNGDIANSWTFAIAALIFLVFLGFIFLYAAFMMLARFIAIVVMLIFSPLMFLGLVLPQFKGYSDTWRKLFVGYAFFAPVYVFFLYLTLYTLIQLRPGGVSNDKGYAGAFVDGGTFSQDMMGIFVFFFVGIGMLYASTKIAAKMASDGAVGIMNFGDKWGKKLSLGLAGAGGALLYRNSAGALANQALRGMDAVDRRLATAQSNNSNRHWTNPRRWAQGAALYGAREVAGGKTTRGAVEGVTNYGAFGGRGRKQARDDMEAQNKRAATHNESANLARLIRAGSIPGAGTDAIIAMEDAVNQASANDLIEFAQTSGGVAALASVAGSIPKSQWDKLAESDKLDAGSRAALSAGRRSSTQVNIARRNNATRNIQPNDPALQVAAGETLSPAVLASLNRASTDELKSLDFQTQILPYAWRLQSSQIESLEKDWGGTKSRLLSQTRSEQINNILDNANTNPGTVDALVRNTRNEKELAKLGVFDNGNRARAIFNSIIQGRTNNFQISRNLLNNFATEVNNSTQKRIIRNALTLEYGGVLPPDIENYFTADHVGRTFPQ